MDGRLFNRGNKTVKSVTGPVSLLLEFDIEKLGIPKVTTVYGGANTDGCYPPPSYKVSHSLSENSESLVYQGFSGPRFYFSPPTTESLV